MLQDVVGKLRQGSGKMVDLEKDIERTRAQSAALKGQLQTLNSVHHSLRLVFTLMGISCNGNSLLV